MSDAVDNGAVLDIDNVSIDFPGGSGGDVVRDASLRIDRGEIRGLVGESGSGKTMLARAVLGLLPPGARVRSGSIRYNGNDIAFQDAEQMRRLRGAAVGMVFQEPMMSLNPALRVGEQMAEAMRLHTGLSRNEIRRRSIEMLERVRMPNPERCLGVYPHEFSGGMRQRIMLASVLMLRPTLLLADEPTTALDVLIQKEILEIMVEIVRDLDTAVLLITHDLGLVAMYSHSVSVMRRGKIVEQGSVAETLMQPRHNYTRQLLAALPRRDRSSSGQVTDQPRTPVVEVRDLQITFSKRGWLPFTAAREVRAVDGLSFDILPNETLAVVGESGSGKTTLGRAILRLVSKSSGTVNVDGADVHKLDRRAGRALRQRTQIIFQDPYSSLNPRMRIGRIVGEGLRLVPGMDRGTRDKTVRSTLESVGIDASWADRYPHQLSGGQRQRVAVARAIIANPRLVVADEAVSALDLTVQAQVLSLLKDLQKRIGFSYLFISHDLGVVEQVADRILVMYRGRIVEAGTRDDVFDRPHHPYTCSLLNAVPELSGDVENGFRLETRNVQAPAPPGGHSLDTSHAEIEPGDYKHTLVSISPTHKVVYRCGMAPDS